jgi:hypothetical protein
MAPTPLFSSGEATVAAGSSSVSERKLMIASWIRLPINVCCFGRVPF